MDAAPLISSLINRTAHRPMLHQPHHLPPHKKGVKCTTMKQGFNQISSLSYLPKKATLGQPKMQLPDRSKLICISAALLSLFSFPTALHSHTLPCASAGICLTCQPVQGVVPAENYSTPSKRRFLLGQLPWIGSLWAGGLSVPLWFCSLKSTSLVWEIAMNPQSKGTANCRSKKQEGKVNYLSHFYCQIH